VPLPPCFYLTDDVFPKVRAEAARRLVEKGWSQVRVAKAIGISQGMVSKHVATKAGHLDPLAARLTAELLASLEAGPARGPSAWCSTLTVSDGRPGGDEALEDLLAAEAMLRAAMPLRFMPQIGLNIARALPDAREPADVLSYPGRLVDAGGSLIAPAPPAFGASGHLARCLLHLRTRDSSILAISNVRGGPAAVRAAKGLGWSVAEIAADRRGDPEAPFRRAVDALSVAPTVLHDGKAPGIEPCLYVCDTDARTMARRVIQLEDGAQGQRST
jgi:predicted fused transcriptional regulator/phosphomethylpyrimidine kinase